MKLLRCLLLTACLAMVAACGQKGDLYFPDQKSAADGVIALESYGLF